MHPILYSFRRCPYAIRARLAIRYSGITVELREVTLSDKPDDMLRCSKKGTVPVLILTDGTVIDESLDIIHWALSINDPDNWLIEDKDLSQKSRELIKANDGPFKEQLDYYKYADRFPEHTAKYYRDQADEFLHELDDLLGQTKYLLANRITIADIAIFPFIRQFSFVDKPWFDQIQYVKLQEWLDNMLDMKLFMDVMEKYPKWSPGNEIVEF